MVFSSLPFLLLFLPVTVLGYYFIQKIKHTYSLFWLVTASFFYYAYWKPYNIFILLGSLFVNYILGLIISSILKGRKIFFIIALVFNISLLCYYKYTDFIINNINSLISTNIHAQHIILPIGISFFTFQQIAYITDIYTKKHSSIGDGLLNYVLFICFFPQLIAGPIVHHKETMPQFSDIQCRVLNWENIYSGLLMISVGLAKKVLVADTISPIVKYAFDKSTTLSFFEASFSSLCYTLQLYFDFSGYCDMAIGIALLFNIKLPWNFDSPYRACTIQDFWRRWHITLSRWLRDYIYIPLGGSRCSLERTLCNFFFTFLLGGLWHGAAWTFVIWGAMHGIALSIHRVWAKAGGSLPKIVGWFLTFTFVNLSWIIFRAQNFDTVKKFIHAFQGKNGWGVSDTFSYNIEKLTLFPNIISIYLYILLILAIALFCKNSQCIQFLKNNKIVFLISSLLFALSILLLCIPDKPQEFIYFQF